MKKKNMDLFGGVTLSDVLAKLISAKNIQPMLDKTFEQMMKVKSRLDAIMPMALGMFSLPSAEDIKKLNNEVTKLDAKLEMLAKLLSEKKKAKKKPTRKTKPASKPSAEQAKHTTVNNTEETKEVSSS
ncbi:MAG: hypothetical protein ACP5JP_06440 [bacterium]